MTTPLESGQRWEGWPGVGAGPKAGMKTWASHDEERTRAGTDAGTTTGSVIEIHPFTPGKPKEYSVTKVLKGE